MPKPNYNWNIAREGKVFVMAKCCDTCPYRTHTDQFMGPIQYNIANDLALPCHETTTGPYQAICRGYYEKEYDKVGALQAADRLGLIKFQE